MQKAVRCSATHTKAHRLELPWNILKELCMVREGTGSGWGMVRDHIAEEFDFILKTGRSLNNFRRREGCG